jgi:hypothetical protein
MKIEKFQTLNTVGQCALYTVRTAFLVLDDYLGSGDGW